MKGISSKGLILHVREYWKGDIETLIQLKIEFSEHAMRKSNVFE